MVKAVCGQASEVALEAQQQIAKPTKLGKAINWKQISPMLLESFRTYDTVGLVFGVERLIS